MDNSSYVAQATNDGGEYPLENKNNEKKPIKNREMPGYGYDKSPDDLAVIGKNRNIKSNEQKDTNKNTK